MSNNQLHGKEFEDYIRKYFFDFSNSKDQLYSFFDITEKYDKIENLPTSIKTTKDGIICLSDARKIWLSNKNKYRLLIGLYNQNENIKNFHTLYEFIITAEEHKKLLGNINYNEVENFHESIKSFKSDYKIARIWSKQKKQSLKLRSIIQLNPKIDHKTQRRLQCSINIKDLITNIKECNVFKKESFYRGNRFEFSIKSSSREYN